MSYGDIVLSTSKSSFLSKCIRWFTKSQFSHSFITMPNTLGIPMCIEAAAGGVDACRFDSNYTNNPDEKMEIWTINIPQEMKDAAIKQLLDELEISYGYLSYPWFMWRKLNKLFGKDIKGQNNWSDNGMICSQLCVAYLKFCGLQEILKQYGNGSISPQDLQDILKAHPELFVLSSSVRM